MIIDNFKNTYGEYPSFSDAEKFLKEYNVTANLTINQPWVIWREKTSMLSLSEIEDVIEMVYK